MVVRTLIDLALLCRMLDHKQMDAILHFAALTHVGESCEQPDSYYQFNTVNSFGLLLEAVSCRPDQAPEVVFFSPSVVFGVPPVLPIGELSLLVPINSYGCSLLSLEWLLEDLASAHIAALDYLITGDSSTDFNLGPGRGYSLFEVVHCEERLSQRTVHIHRGARRLGVPPALICDASKARELFHWVPHFSDLDFILADSMAWERQRQSINGLERHAVVLS